MEPRSSCTASQDLELNHSATAALCMNLSFMILYQTSKHYKDMKVVAMKIKINWCH